MTDDIVIRLREGHGQGCKCYAHCYCKCGCDAEWAEYYIKEAADEIERLREENIQYEMAFEWFKKLDEIRLELIQQAAKEMQRTENEIEHVRELNTQLEAKINMWMSTAETNTNYLESVIRNLTDENARLRKKIPQ